MKARKAMSGIPTSFIDDLRSRVPLSDVVARRVTWDSRKSKHAKGDFWALCPFHQEKSPSFHVDDRRGYYHCFGCHAKGDHISFLRDQEGMGFLDAVEALAAMAGVEVPRDGRRREGPGEDALKWNEEAVAFYRESLRAAEGIAALAYLKETRGLSDETIDAFELGYAPDDSWALLKRIKDRGGSWEAAVGVGLATWREGDKAPFAIFRNRITFPIRDPRGRCIGFGGRAMSSGTRAKYLNTPETPWFDKSRTLYNHGRARGGAARGGQLILVEGYMDVIGLTQAGIEGVVAPLGTAVTADHLEHAWRMAEEPIIALDGDSAGIGAALRTADIALPLLEPGRALRFAMMPSGMDPDDVVRKQSVASFRAVIEASHSMVEMLWRRETYRVAIDSPERRAAFDVRLKAILERIEHPVMREHYRMDLATRREALYRQRCVQEQGVAKNSAASVRRSFIPSPVLRRSWIA